MDFPATCIPDRRQARGCRLAQLLDTHQDQQRVTVSCLVCELRFEWRLEPVGDGTRITVDVEIPDSEAHRLDSQRQIISASMTQLAQLAGDGSPEGGMPAR